MSVRVDAMSRSRPLTVPRRSRWPLVLPFILVVVLAFLWSGLWFFASAKAETTLNGWREREAKAGRTYTCEQQSIGGYPFRIEVRCLVPAAVFRGVEPPLAFKAKDLLAAVQVYDPNLVISELKGPLTIGEPDKPPAFVANWRLGQSSVRGTPEAPQRLSFVFEAPVVERIGEGDGNAKVFKAERAELHGRISSGSAANHPVVDLALLLQSATSALHPAANEPVDADVVAVLRGLRDFAPKPWAERLREMQAADGQIEIVKARVQQEDVIAVGTGTLSLTAGGNLNGNLQVTVVNLDKVLKKFDLERVMSEGQVGASFNSLDRLIPGLGNIVRQNAPSLVASLGQRTILEGKAAVALPLRFVDGAVYLGPIPVGRTPPVF